MNPAGKQQFDRRSGRGAAGNHRLAGRTYSGHVEDRSFPRTVSGFDARTIESASQCLEGRPHFRNDAILGVPRTTA